MDPTTWLSLLIAVVTLATPALSTQPRVVCYYTNWSVYRPGTARFNPQNINPYLCTHLVYAFGGFTKDNTLKPFDKYQDIEKGGYAKFTGLKTYNKQLKTLLAIGGWNEGSSRFSPMVASRERRKEFVRNAIKFLRQNHFDGLDLDWEYPAFRDGGKPKDREHYAKLVRELREEFERESEKTGKTRLLLTMAVPAGIEYIQKGFDVKTLNKYLDWMNLLTYDYHSAFEPAVNHHAPLYPLEEPNEYSVDNELNIDYTIKYYLDNGADRDKLVLGIPTYGRSYTLFNKDATEIGAPADGPGEQGDATREKGYLAYYEICEALKPKQQKKRAISDDDSEEDDSSEEEVDEPWTVVQPNPKAMGPYAYRGNQWVGYDDIDIVRKKAEYVAENGLGGIMFWSIDNDDFRGTCHGKPYPLIEAAKEAYIVKLGSTDNSIVTDRPRSSTVRSTSNRRRNRPRSSTTTTTTERAVAAKSSNKRKSASSITSTTPTWNIVTPEPPTTPDPGSDFKCTDEGFFPHPRDCKKYFWCLDSGPSNLGIVAHQFTCPSGLFFNKAADSCDFARNVLCKKPGATTKAPTTKPTATTTTTTSTTTRKPVKLSTKSASLFRTTTTTTTTPEPEEEEYEEEAEDSAEIDAEDPKVIKELIDLIRKVGGVEQLEKQLHLSESSSTDGAITTTPASIAINKRLYQKVLERTIGKSNKINGNSGPDGGSPLTALYSRRGPQNAGLEPTEDKDKLLKKDRPQYTTINRSRPSTSTQQPESEDEDDDLEDIPVSGQRQTQARVVEVSSQGTTAKPLQYVNIRRARPLSTSDTADDSASRNALFERAETFVTVTETVNSLDIASARRENIPEYVTIRRQRPTTEEATTEQYQNPEPEESQETALEREISSPQISSQPQYISIARFRSTTTTSTPTPEQSSPEPTTVLAVQISSLLNSPSSEIETSEEDTKTTIDEATETIPTTTPTTTTRAPSSTATRRTILRRRGTTTTTQATPSSSTQVSSRNYSFVRRRRPNAQPNEIASDSTEDSELSRKIRSTTPDSRETESARTESVQPRRARVRFQQTQQVDDSVPAAASPVSRGRFRPEFSRDELISLTPVDVDIPRESPRFVPRSFGSRSESRFRGSTTVSDKTEDSEVSAATVEIRRPNIIPRGRGRFTPSSTTAALDESQVSESTPSPRRPTFARFSPRPFSRTVSTPAIDDEESEDIVTSRLPTRLPFGRARVLTSTAATTISSLPVQPRRNLFSARQYSSPRPTSLQNEEEIDQNKDDIDLSESTVAEQGHEDSIDAGDELPKRRVVIKKHRTPVSSTTESTVSTEAVQISEDGKKRIRVIKRRPASSTQATEEPVPESNENSSPAPQRIRKVIRKKIKLVEDEPEIIAKSIGSLTSARDLTTEIVANYGEKSRPVSSTLLTPIEFPVEKSTDEINEPEATKEENTEVSNESNNDKPAEEENNKQTEESNSTNSNKEDESISNTESEPKPAVAVETEVKAIDLSENNENNASEEPQQDIEETAPITPATTTTIKQQPSSTPRGRAPYRPPKRTFTTATESSIPSSSRTFSRKFNPGVYTSPATPGEKTSQATTRKPFTFTRRPFTRTTKKVVEEEELYSEEEEDFVEPEEEHSLVIVPPNQLFSKRPKPSAETEESEQVSGEETETEEEQPQRFIPRRPPTFRPKAVNSNTFRTTSSTTELPKRKQNRTAIYTRFSGNTETKKRVQNVPFGYSPPADKAEIDNEEDSKEYLTTTLSFTEETESTTDDDYLSMTETTGSFNTDDVTSTNTVDGETTMSGIDIDDSTDDYLESTEGTTNLPTTRDFYLQTQTDKETTSYEHITTFNTEASLNSETTTTESIPETTTATTSTTTTTTTTTTPAPVVKTQYDKLFSVSRVVEVNSKLDKHRLNKKNETTLVEEGQIMVEKRPTLDKIGEVSRFSLIKIYEDEIPIYLTKLGHVYPVENPPDHFIRIDEARNARALVNFADAPKENLIASESMNEAYRHINKVTNQPKDEPSSKGLVEHVSNDNFLKYINDDKKNSKSDEDISFTQWQFIPAAYENEQNKGAKSFEIVTPRGMLTEPSTLPLEALFKTENPMARKVDQKGANQPFLVYSASLPKEEAKQSSKTDNGQKIITFAKGQEIHSGPVTEQATVKSPIDILSQTSQRPSSTIISIISDSTSPIIEMMTTALPTTLTTEPSTIALTTDAATTETVVEETTTTKSPLDTKRTKFAFPRRPAFKPTNVTRPTIVPRLAKKNNTLSGNLKKNNTLSGNLYQKPNKTSTFNAAKTRYTGNRSQNVPVDIRKKTTKVPIKTFTTETPRTTTERRLYVKPFRPNLRPAFVPRRNTTPSTQTITDT
ncbi:hypothetical protein O0L34_g6283 [Tuta absoluta]|nr:hypothetical protein O0L34_g6283 [Tuta absoluta]